MTVATEAISEETVLILPAEDVQPEATMIVTEGILAADTPALASEMAHPATLETIDDAPVAVTTHPLAHLPVDVTTPVRDHPQDATVVAQDLVLTTEQAILSISSRTINYNPITPFSCSKTESNNLQQSIKSQLSLTTAI